MSVDIYHSRRGHFNKCVYYKRDEDNSVGDLTKWILETNPTGVFYAKEVSQKSNQENQVGNVILMDNHSITLETADEVMDIKRGYVVKYLGQCWLVTNVQFATRIKENEFQKEKYTTYISLVR